MTRISIKLALTILACICIIYMAVPSIASAQSTIIKVDVLANGDARWTTEKMISLDTPGDVAGWDETAALGTETYQAEFDARMKEYVARISTAVGRPMTVKGVNVTVEKAHPYALSDNGSTTYGVIRYEFTWTGFARSEPGFLEVGDAFVDGFLLNKDDTITFILPAGYDISSISPSADDLKNAYQPQVKWFVRSQNNTGTDIRLFSSGEPSIIMRKSAAAALGFEWWMLVPAILISAAVGFGAAYVLLKRQQSPPVEVPQLPDRVVMPDAGVEPPEELPGLSDGRFMSDEEKVVMYLEEAGGQMFQSDLVKKTDFSKSKLSMVLSDLKEKGTILKIKKGKENLIRLNRPSNEAQDPGEAAE